MSSPPLEANQTELAKILRVSRRTLTQWDQDGLREAALIDSSGRASRYDVAAAFWWYHERELERLRETMERSEDKEAAARLRKLEAEADSKELDLAVKRGALVPIDEVEDLVRESLEAVDSVLRHSPSRVAPQLAKSAKVSVKVARTIMREVVESTRAAIREGARLE